MLELLQTHGLPLVFLNVLIEQAGVPIPAWPVLIMTGAMVSGGHFSLVSLWLTAATAALLADVGWYLAGRRAGRRILRLLCRISLSPDSCVRQTESIYTRFGAASLMFAKFIPGFASIATALAGAMRIPAGRFLAFDAIGCLLWAGLAILIGRIFDSAIDEILAVLTQLGRWGAMLAAVALAAFVASKWWQRHRFNQQIRMDRISVPELADLIDAGEAPVILDVRTRADHAEGRIPGALTATEQSLGEVMQGVERERELVLYCACPNEASAARLARRLRHMGYQRVRPLAGGIDAWAASGRALE